MRNGLLFAIAVAASILVGLYVWNKIEHYDEEVNLGWLDKARTQPFFAAEKLLEKNGIIVTNTLRFDTAIEIDNINTIILPDSSYAPRESQQERLRDWVYEGGHLLIGSGSVNEKEFLYDLGFSSEYVYEDDEKDSDETSSEDEEFSFADELRKQNEEILARQEQEPVNTEQDEQICLSYFVYECHPMKVRKFDESEISSVYFTDDEKTRFADGTNLSLSHHSLDEEGYYWTGTGTRTTFIQAPYGDGYYSVITDIDLFRSPNLGQLEHAYFLFKLLDGDERVLIIYGRDTADLWTLIKRNFAKTLFAAVCLLLASIVYFSRRFGPLYDVLDQSHRKLSERLGAAGQFSWRVRDEEKLIENLRLDISRKVKRHDPAFEDCNQQEQIAVLAELSGINADAIEYAMYSEFTFHEQKYFSIVNTLQKLRKSL
jgi:hypothetical protein